MAQPHCVLLLIGVIVLVAAVPAYASDNLRASVREDELRVQEDQRKLKDDEARLAQAEEHNAGDEEPRPASGGEGLKFLSIKTMTVGNSDSERMYVLKVADDGRVLFGQPNKDFERNNHVLRTATPGRLTVSDILKDIQDNYGQWSPYTIAIAQGQPVGLDTDVFELKKEADEENRRFFQLVVMFNDCRVKARAMAWVEGRPVHGDPVCLSDYEKDDYPEILPSTTVKQLLSEIPWRDVSQITLTAIGKGSEPRSIDVQRNAEQRLGEFGYSQEGSFSFTVAVKELKKGHITINFGKGNGDRANYGRFPVRNIDTVDTILRQAEKDRKWTETEHGSEKMKLVEMQEDQPHYSINHAPLPQAPSLSQRIPIFLCSDTVHTVVLRAREASGPDVPDPFDLSGSDFDFDGYSISGASQF